MNKKKNKVGRPKKDKRGFAVSIYILPEDEKIWKEIEKEALEKKVGVGSVICNDRRKVNK